MVYVVCCVYDVCGIMCVWCMWYGVMWCGLLKQLSFYENNLPLPIKYPYCASYLTNLTPVH